MTEQAITLSEYKMSEKSINIFHNTGGKILILQVSHLRSFEEQRRNKCTAKEFWFHVTRSPDIDHRSCVYKLGTGEGLLISSVALIFCHHCAISTSQRLLLTKPQPQSVYMKLLKRN